MGKEIERQKQQARIPKKERPSLRWNKLKEYTGIWAGRLKNEVKGEREIRQELESTHHRLFHKALRTSHHSQLEVSHEIKKLGVEGLTKGIDGAVKDVKTYKWHNDGYLPEDASKKALIESIRKEHSAYASPASSTSSTPNSSPSRSPTHDAASTSRG